MAGAINDRNTYLNQISNFGNDPLTDKLIGKLVNLPAQQSYRIQKRNEFRPDKIAAKFLLDSAYYWVILEYNRLASAYDLLAGTIINIPDPNYLSQLLVSVNNSQATTSSIFIK